MKKILITGATKGLGREAAMWFAKKKQSLILVGRNEKELKKLINKLPNKKKHSFLCIDLQNPSEISKIKPKDKLFNTLYSIIHCAGGGLDLRILCLMKVYKMD